MTRTKIEWCDWTWNPVVGCTRGCPYCYARRIATRFHMTRDFSVPEWREASFARPFPRRPSRIFVNSMSDVADWPADWTRRVFERIESSAEARAGVAWPQHKFLFLSKRPWLWATGQLPSSAMLGYSATNQEDVQALVNRVRGVSFLSFEPLHGPIRLWGAPPRWIIVGAETGNRRELVRPETAWLQDIADFARAHSVPLFFKDSLAPYWPGELPREYPEAGRT